MVVTNETAAVTKETAAVTKETPMEEDGDEGEEAYVVKTSSQDSMTESKTESIAASNGRWDCLCLDFLI